MEVFLYKGRGDMAKKKKSLSRPLAQIRSRRGKFLRFFNKVTGGYIDNALQTEASAISEVFRGREATDDDDRQLLGFRRISAGNFDLSPVEYDKMISVCVWLWQRNPLAKRFVEDVKDAIIGEGISYKKTGHKQTDKILEAFWWDKDNNWDLKGEIRARELGLMGEMIPTAFVSKQTGAVRLGYINPNDVKQVGYNKDNKEEALEVLLKTSTTRPEEKKYPVIRRDRNGTLGEAQKKKFRESKDYEEKEVGRQFDTEGRLMGDQTKVGTNEPVGVFYFAVNKLRSQTRGISDLWIVADWVDVYDKILFDMADREALIKAFIYDITMEGATPAQCRAKVAALMLNPPTAGSFQVHNEKEKWQAVTPNINAKDTAVVANLIKGMATTGVRLTNTWYGEGDSKERSGKAQEQMTKPTTMMLRQRQKYLKYAIEMMLDFALDQAILASHLKYESDEEEREVRAKVGAVMPEISQEDSEKVSDVISKVTTALVTAQTQAWITGEDAAKVFTMILSKLGMDIEPADEETVKQQADKVDTVAKLTGLWNKSLTDKDSEAS